MPSRAVRAIEFISYRNPTTSKASYNTYTRCGVDATTRQEREVLNMTHEALSGLCLHCTNATVRVSDISTREGVKLGVRCHGTF